MPPYDTTPWHIEGLDDGNNINYYLSYELDSTYGEESGDFGFSRYLTLDEYNEFSPDFKEMLQKANIPMRPELLKYVDWCYYNCCEAEDYYVNFDQDDIIAMKKKVEEKYK